MVVSPDTAETLLTSNTALQIRPLYQHSKQPQFQNILKVHHIPWTNIQNYYTPYSLNCAQSHHLTYPGVPHSSSLTLTSSTRLHYLPVPYHFSSHHNTFTTSSYLSPSLTTDHVPVSVSPCSTCIQLNVCSTYASSASSALNISGTRRGKGTCEHHENT